MQRVLQPTERETKETGMTMALIANKMIRFAADYVEVDSEVEEE